MQIVASVHQITLTYQPKKRTKSRVFSPNTNQRIMSNKLQILPKK